MSHDYSFLVQGFKKSRIKTFFSSFRNLMMIDMSMMTCMKFSEFTDKTGSSKTAFKRRPLMPNFYH